MNNKYRGVKYNLVAQEIKWVVYLNLGIFGGIARYMVLFCVCTQARGHSKHVVIKFTSVKLLILGV